MARNARFTLSPNHVQLIATGKVAAAVDWTVDVPAGAPRAQRRDPDTGMPVWLIDALDESDPEATRAAVVAVEVTAMEEPAPAKYAPLELSAARVALYVDKRGQLVLTYVATLKAAAVRSAAAA